MRVEAIRQALEAALAPQKIEIADDSHLHAGHVGAKGGGHYRVLVVSDKFRGRPLIGRHRLVYEALAELMHKDIHAVSIVAKTPEEAAG